MFYEFIIAMRYVMSREIIYYNKYYTKSMYFLPYIISWDLTNTKIVINDVMNELTTNRWIKLEIL